MKTYSKNNLQMCSIKKVFLFSKIHRKTPVPEPLFQENCKPESYNFIKKRLWQRCFSVNFAKFLRTPFFAEHVWLTASNICMQVVVIYNLNLFLQFVTINFTFPLLRVFTLAHDLLFGRVILSHALQDRF